LVEPNDNNGNPLAENDKAPAAVPKRRDSSMMMIMMMMNFEEWISVHKNGDGDGKSHQQHHPYSSAEEFVLRKQIYERNLSRWRALNEIPGGARFGPELEAHADRTPDEFAELVAGCYRESDADRTNQHDKHRNHRPELPQLLFREQRRLLRHSTTRHPIDDPTSSATKATTAHYLSDPFTIMDVDWRSHAPPPNDSNSSNTSANTPISYVTPVKNQGPHGTCWSFAVAENLEGLGVRQGHDLQNVSEQEFISCCSDCQGRAADVTFEWLLNHTGGFPALEDT
jgi:hypothetical protein